MTRSLAQRYDDELSNHWTRVINMNQLNIATPHATSFYTTESLYVALRRRADRAVDQEPITNSERIDSLDFPAPLPETLKLGGVVLEPRLHAIIHSAGHTRLPPKTFTLLWVLARSHDRALSYTRLIALLWGRKATAPVVRVRLRLHVMRLRRVLENNRIKGLDLINRGRVGYVLKVAANSETFAPSRTSMSTSRRGSRARSPERAGCPRYATSDAAE